MARMTPVVKDQTLTWHTDDQQEQRLVVGTPDWYHWLAQASTFAFLSDRGTFTARKERRQRGSVYWQAYRKQQGKLYRRYLGKTEQLSLERLNAVAFALVQAMQGEGDERMPPSARAEGLYDTGPSIKLQVPPLPSSVVHRARLLDLLQQGMSCSLILVSAPAGFGKTMLLSDWLSQGGLSTAWLSLETDDNDPARFLSQVLAAFATLDLPLTIFSPLLFSPAAMQGLSLEWAFTTLVDDLLSCEGDVALVLDDYEAITAEPVHRAIRYLVEHCPPHLHLVISTRTDPPLPLARLRAQNQLCEIRVAQLQFRADEASAFLRKVMGFELPAQTEALLEQRTEGWIVGLQLAALSLQGRMEEGERGMQQFMADFTGSHRHIMDYLFEEVFTHQPEAVQSFLLHTSILDRLAAPLCDAVAGGSESAAMLEYLEQANLFLAPLDEQRHWYRYHPLFAEMLCARLQQEVGKPYVATLYGRASAWYEQNGSPLESVEAALHAFDFVRAATLIEPLSYSLLVRFQHYTLRRFLERLPKDVLFGRSNLCLAYAWALYLARRMDSYQMPLDEAERLFRFTGQGSKLGEAYALRALAASRQGDALQAIDFGSQALALLPADALLWRSASMNAQAGGYVLTGDTTIAWQTLTEVRTLCELAGNVNGVLDATRGMAEVLVMQGKLHEGAEMYQSLIESAEERQSFAGEALIGRGNLLREWNDLVAAEAHIRQALALARQAEDNVLLARSSLALARVMQAHGEGAEKQVDEAFASAVVLAQQSQHTSLHAQAQAYQVRLWLVQGKLDVVSRWQAAIALNSNDPPAYEQEASFFTLARVLLAQDEADEAQRILERWRTHAHAQGRIGSEIESLSLTALASQAQRRTERAVQLLQQALVLAEPGGYVRLFLDEGAPMASLLTMVAARWKGKEGAYVNTLLTLGLHAATRPPLPFAAGTLSPLNEALSQRERKVLRLLVAGLSTPEIARELGVSINTVKTHVKKIYQKLYVSSRKEAIVTAKLWKLL